jgi:hypothetical protein
MHEALALYHTTGGFDPRAVYDRAGARPEPEIEAEMERLMGAYVAHDQAYSILGEDERTTVLAAEWPFVVSIPTPTGWRSNYQLIGWVDLVVRMGNGDIWVWDHKTGKSFPSAPGIAMDAQLTSYAWALHRLGLPVAGVGLNLIKTTKQPEVMRLRLPKMNAELDHWGEILYARCRSLPPPRVDWERQPRHPSRDCSWDCEYLTLCQLDVEGSVDAYLSVRSTDYEVHDRSRGERDLSLYSRTVPLEWKGR